MAGTRAYFGSRREIQPFKRTVDVCEGVKSLRTTVLQSFRQAVRRYDPGDKRRVTFDDIILRFSALEWIFGWR